MTNVILFSFWLSVRGRHAEFSEYSELSDNFTNGSEFSDNLQKFPKKSHLTSYKICDIIYLQDKGRHKIKPIKKIKKVLDKKKKMCYNYLVKKNKKKEVL